MLNGLILLEGADGTGKTTLAKFLVERYGGHYIHLTYRYPNNMFEYHAAALHRAVKLSESRLVVLDRQWVSESLYAEAYRGGTKWPHMGRLFDRVMLKHAGLYVFCLADSLTTHAERFEKLKTERPELFDNATKVASLYERLYWGDDQFPGYGYARDWARKGGFQLHATAYAYRIEHEGKNLGVFAQLLEDKMQAMRFTQYKYALEPFNYNFLGHAGFASYLFIGDRINKTNRQIAYPWYANINSSLFLNECLSDLGWVEDQFCYVNINDPHGMTHALDVMSRFHLRPIALGRSAQKLLKLPEHSFVPHPQAGRRFMGRPHYVELLREARDAAY